MGRETDMTIECKGLTLWWSAFLNYPSPYLELHIDFFFTCPVGQAFILLVWRDLNLPEPSSQEMRFFIEVTQWLSSISWFSQSLIEELWRILFLALPQRAWISQICLLDWAAVSLSHFLIVFSSQVLLAVWTFMSRPLNLLVTGDWATIRVKPFCL